MLPPANNLMEVSKSNQLLNKEVENVGCDTKQFYCMEDEIEVISTGTSTLRNDNKNEQLVDTNTTTHHNQLERINDNDYDDHEDGDGDDDDEREDANKIRKWKQSPFAVGLTYPTWQDEKIWCFIRQLHSNNSQQQQEQSFPKNYFLLGCTAIIFRYVPWVSRVGNMVVIKKKIIPECTDPYTKDIILNRPRIQCVVGPYWMVLLGVTLPIFVLLFCWTVYKSITVYSWQVICTWLLCYMILLFSLINVSCRDPGIMYRYKEKPQQHHQPQNQQQQQQQQQRCDCEEWIWNSQALSYRPKSALYDSECGVIIQELDHVCPWTGTAIGRNNIFWFRLFICFLPITILYTIALLANAM